MSGVRIARLMGCALTAFGLGCAQPAEQAAEAATDQAAAAPNRQAEFGRFPDREFIRRNLAQLDWQPLEGNALGVERVILEGDPSKPGYYLTVNRFPPGVMSRPHFHAEERWGLVVKGTWYTGEGDEFTPSNTVPLTPGDYMRHPAGGAHFDGALDEEVLVAIGGYGPSGTTVIDGGDLFTRSK